jgi:uncharacterized membrane protein (DUF373 family)
MTVHGPVVAAPGSRSSRWRLERTHRPLTPIDRVETLVHYLVACLLLVIAGVVLFQTVAHLIANRNNFPLQVTSAINDLLFVVILMELLRTVVAHLESEDFQLASFLIVGIIAGVRHIVGVGARLTLSGAPSGSAFMRAQIELGVGAAVVLALAVAFLLVGRAAVPRR